MELIFQHGPRYVGHALAVPEIGDHYALPQEGEGRALVRTPQGIELISNVCRHRQAVMLRGRGNTQAKHRLPAAPLDLRPEGRADRRAALSRKTPACT
jgi:phenylpropionate dioxygenase-like ring-hydroxylating dioxygenase large terminal subunit